MTTGIVMANQQHEGLGLANLDKYEKTKGWLDQSIAWVLATRGMVDIDAVSSWEMLDWPMNQFKTGRIHIRGKEVGEAYNKLFSMCIEDEAALEAYPEEYASAIISTKFILTIEEDNIVPSNAVLDLMGAIYSCPDCEGTPSGEDWKCENGHRGYDAVSGLYFTKGLPPRPMAYGNPANGPYDFSPQSVEKNVKDRSVLEVNGIGMGCAIWRKDLFRKVSKPWFETTQADNAAGTGGGTQDLFFCKKAKEEDGARFGVHCGVHVGHVNPKNGRIS